MYLIVSWQNSRVQIDIMSYIIKFAAEKVKASWATVSTTFLWSSQVLQSPKIKWHRAAREVESPRSECVENRSSLKMMIIKTSFSLDCQPLLTSLLRSCSCGWRCSSYTVFSGAQSAASSCISWGSCLSSIFAPEHCRLSSISTATKYVGSVTKIHGSRLTLWHHDTIETFTPTGSWEAVAPSPVPALWMSSVASAPTGHSLSISTTRPWPAAATGCWFTSRIRSPSMRPAAACEPGSSTWPAGATSSSICCSEVHRNKRAV